MGKFNAKEILEIAIQNENNGIAFYSALTELSNKASVKYVLSKIIQEEQSHVKTLKKIINTFLEEDKALRYYDDPEELLYLRAIADATIFTDDPDSPGVKEALMDVMSALQYALSIEVKSVAFYKQIKEVMTNGSGKEVVDTIIKEEKGHINNLYEMIKKEEKA